MNFNQQSIPASDFILVVSKKVNSVIQDDYRIIATNRITRADTDSSGVVKTLSYKKNTKSSSKEASVTLYGVTSIIPVPFLSKRKLFSIGKYILNVDGVIDIVPISDTLVNILYDDGGSVLTYESSVSSFQDILESSGIREFGGTIGSDNFYQILWSSTSGQNQSSAIFSDGILALQSSSSDEANNDMALFTSVLSLNPRQTGTVPKGGRFELNGTDYNGVYQKQTGLTFNTLDYRIDLMNSALFSMVIYDSAGNDLSSAMNIESDPDGYPIVQIADINSYLGFYGALPIEKQSVDVSSGSTHSHIVAIGEALENLGLINFTS